MSERLVSRVHALFHPHPSRNRVPDQHRPLPSRTHRRWHVAYGYCPIRKLLESTGSHVAPSVHRDPFEVVLLFGAERMGFKSPSSLCLNSATTRDVLFRSKVLRKTAYKRRQERINANRRRARDQLPILLVGLHLPTLDHTTVPFVLPTQTQLSLSVG